MKKETVGTILALSTAFISGLAIPANKLFVVDLDPTVFTAVRALVIGIVFFIFASFQSKSKKFKKVPWGYLLAIAIIGGSFAFLMFFSGLNRLVSIAIGSTLTWVDLSLLSFIKNLLILDPFPLIHMKYFLKHFFFWYGKPRINHGINRIFHSHTLHF